jgi:hypothetical protein
MSFSITQNTRALARRLLDGESGARSDAIVKVSEKLRLSLGSVLGVVGFRMLLYRALLLTSTDIGNMEKMSVRYDGTLVGVDDFAARSTQKQVDEGGEALISRLLVLAEIFLGDALIRNLIEGIWPTTHSKNALAKTNNT